MRPRVLILAVLVGVLSGLIVEWIMGRRRAGGTV